MTRHAPGHIPLWAPTLLSFVAGYVDSCTFLALFGLFIAQATGSFVLTGTQIVTGDTEAVIKIIAIPVFFLAAAITTIIATAAGRVALVCMLGLECALLIGFLAIGLAVAPFHGPNAPGSLAAAVLGLSAMGVQSALVRLQMRGYGSTSVMTTNTTQLAIDSTDTLLAWRALRRAPDDPNAAAEWRAARRRLKHLLPLVLGFLVGTCAGAVGYQTANLPCLALPIALLLGLTGWAIRRVRVRGLA
jgi:uncharacterized membrane protein YoaK (UPF0700 family)